MSRLEKLNNSTNETWQLFIKGIRGNTTRIEIKATATPGQLLKLICNTIGLPEDEARVIYAGKQLEYNHPTRKSLVDYQLHNESTLHVVMRLRGGRFPTSLANYLARGIIDGVPTTLARCCVTWEDSHQIPRILMPCSHAITQEALISLCKKQIGAGAFRFTCPIINCAKEWDFHKVRMYTALTPEETEYFETEVNKNYITCLEGVNCCPGCHSYCERMNKADKRVNCRLCTMDKSKTFDFCWYCQQPWKTSNTHTCGNNNCSGLDPRIKILQDASHKVIVDIPDCPTTRACIKCGCLIEHIDLCKQMVCKRCACPFCFVCLKPNSVCSESFDKCIVAAVQNVIPSLLNY